MSPAKRKDREKEGFLAVLAGTESWENAGGPRRAVRLKAAHGPKQAGSAFRGDIRQARHFYGGLKVEGG